MNIMKLHTDWLTCLGSQVSLRLCWLQGLSRLRKTQLTQIRPHTKCSIRHTKKFSRCKWNSFVVIVVIYAYNKFFPCFNFSIILCFVQKSNMHKHAYIHYRNNSDLSKIQVTQNLQQWNEWVSWGAPVPAEFKICHIFHGQINTLTC
jgi:hypothetical protein